MLLASDPVLPSVATIVAGAPVRGSWWAHRKSRAIFAAIRALDHHPDVVAVPLVRGKMTFVERRFWPALLAIAQSGEAWQRRGLSQPARALMARVTKRGAVQASGIAVREVERRLLAHGHEVHTERGAHAKEVETWERWAAREKVLAGQPAATARAAFEAIVDGWGARGVLPWQSARP
jgi:hypothetical protein